MYNRYIPNGTSYTRVVEQDAPETREADQQAFHRVRQEPPHRAQQETPPHRPRQEPSYQRPRQEGASSQGRGQTPLSSLLGGFMGEKKHAGLAGMLEKLKLDDIDTGDILLILILLFLFRDGDDIELVIALALLLLLGLGDKEQDDERREEDQFS